MKLSNDQEILNAVVSKAWKDPVFKENLLANPLTTIENFLGYKVKLPEGKNISFVDQSDETTIFINIPAEAKIDDVELDEEQLDIVSGGEGVPIPIKPSNYSDTIFTTN